MTLFSGKGALFVKLIVVAERPRVGRIVDGMAGTFWVFERVAFLLYL